MTDDILNIAKWKNKYPFLDKVWDTYKEFEKPVQQTDTHKTFYDGVCHKIISDLKGDIQNHKPYCMKLIRNLGHYIVDSDYFNPTFERCDILYNWLYHSSKSDQVTDIIIEKCFKDYNDQMEKMTRTYKCSYYLYKNMYLDPIKINILNLFENNMQIIKSILNGHEEKSKIPCRKFVCDCLKIYKYMKVAYCNSTGYHLEKLTGTCLKLSQFEGSYKFLRDSIVSINPNIPSLDNIDSGCLDERPSLEKQVLLTLRDQGDTSHHYGNALGEPAGDQDSELAESFSGPIVNEDSPMKKTITTTIGTVAGASSLLAFLYNFTPAGRLVNPKLRRTTGIINNNFYGDDVNEHNGFNSYNIGYEAV